MTLKHELFNMQCRFSSKANFNRHDIFLYPVQFVVYCNWCLFTASAAVVAIAAAAALVGVLPGYKMMELLLL